MTANTDDDVSAFTLDVYWAAGRPADARLERHIEGCARCQGYLASLEAEHASGSASHAVGRAPWTEPTATSGPARLVGRRWPWPLAAAAAVAAGVFLEVRAKPVDSPVYVGVKGAPGVELLIHRGTDTHVWDGRGPVRPGDALAVRVACEGLGHVSVASPNAGRWKRLSDVPCPGSGEALPFTLVVDGQAGDEKLAIVLSQAVLDDAALSDAIAGAKQTGDVWVADFVLPKETGGDR
jgi:hypothetical protein